MKILIVLFLILLFISTQAFSQPQPIVNVSNNPSGGKLFLSNFFFNPQTPNTPYLLIVNNDGSIFWSRPIKPNSNGLDFKKQPNGTYTYFEWFPKTTGQLSGKYYQLNSDFILIDSFTTGNGLPTDGHELVIKPNGNVLIMSYDTLRIDMSQIVSGGNTNALVFGTTLQELDLNKNVVFQWRSWDHYNILDMLHRDFTLPVLDVVHGNAIEADYDGHLLHSARHLCEITKINRQTGAIIWRLGGNNNEFTFVNDPVIGDTNHRFCSQHDIRRLPNGNITLYDNGNFNIPQKSRAVEYQIDEVNKIATLVWEYRKTPDIYAGAMGNVQRLPNGNTLIGWGSKSSPILTEVTPLNQIALEMSFPVTGMFSYRAFKFGLDAPLLNMILNLKVVPQGFFNIPLDELNMRDTVRCYLRSIIPPYPIIDSAISLLDSTNATARLNFFQAPSGNYYIVVKHRNSIETWSKLGGQLLLANSVNEYSFASGQSQAYEDNQILINGIACIYSGDVNQDGIIDASDLSLVDNAARQFKTGYVATDVTGDRFVDGTDLIITENNALNVVQIRRP